MPARFYWLNSLALLLLATGIVLLMQTYPAADFAVSDWFYQNANGFVYVDHWLWRNWLHDDVRRVIKPAKMLFSVFLLGLLLWPKSHHCRGAALYTLVTLLACNGVVSWLKGITGRVCPNELTSYGGDYVWQPLFSSVLEKADGHCWPGGHALHAFALLPIIYAFILLHKPKATRWAIGLIAGFGLLLSVTQIVRGQHFLSDQLATLFFCWLTSFIGFIVAHELAPRLASFHQYGLLLFQKNRIVNG